LEPNSLRLRSPLHSALVRVWVPAGDLDTASPVDPAGQDEVIQLCRNQLQATQTA